MKEFSYVGIFAIICHLSNHSTCLQTQAEDGLIQGVIDVNEEGTLLDEALNEFVQVCTLLYSFYQLVRRATYG